MKDKKQLRNILKNSLNLRFNIKSKRPDPEQVSKSLFIDTMKTMNDIQDRSSFLAQEMGIDIVGFEDRYFRVIENLFKLNFNQEQLSLIQLYLYELNPDKNWDGTIELQLKEDTKVVSFKDPKDVWEVINLFK
tara:strand:+ start:7557 stop:7955 length:399 start_codon:yes stop_codon:yes gene_type:complete